MFESVGMCKEACEAYLKVNIYILWMDAFKFIILYLLILI